MIDGRQVMHEAIAALEEWLDGTYTLANSGSERQEYKIVQLNRPGLIFEFRPTCIGTDAEPERFRIVIGVERVR
jgi:hypothetical protein